eukprot:4033_1
MDSSYKIQGRRSQNSFLSSNDADVPGLAPEFKAFAADSLLKGCIGSKVSQCNSLERIAIILKKQMTVTTPNVATSHHHTPDTKRPDNMKLKQILTSSLLAIYQSEVYGNEQPMKRLNQTSLYDFITTQLGSNYHSVALLNDFHHLLFEHNTAHDFESIYNALMSQTVCKYTALQCPLMQYITDTETKHDSESTKEMETIQTIAQIHCYFVHSYHIGYRVSYKELQSIQLSSEDERLSMIYDIIHDKHSKSQTHHHKYISNARRRHKVTGKMHGTKYYYWDSYKTRHSLDPMNGRLVSDWYIAPKYGDLKEELTSKMSKETLECFIVKTGNVMQCDKVKKTCANGAAQLLREYAIDKRSHITHNHILALLSYCNHYDVRRALVYSFKSKLHHSEYVYLAKYLRECTEIYGHSVHKDTDDIYHCILSDRFHQFMISFDVPKSCTDSLCVAVNVNSDIQNGLILQLSRAHVHTQVSSFFDCKWLSHAVYENEMLFFNPSETFTIENIVDMEHTLNYSAYISAMHVFDDMLHSGHATHTPSKNDVEMIGLLLQNELKKTKHGSVIDADIPFYVDRLFSVWCENAQEIIRIDIDKLHDVYHTCKHYLITDDDSWIDVHSLCVLFKNVRQLIIKGLRLTDATFKRLTHWMDTQKSTQSQSNLSHIVLQYPNEDDTCVEDALRKYGDAIQYRNWDIFHYQELHNDDLITIHVISRANTNTNTAVDIELRAFELWKTIQTKRDIDGKELLSYIQHTHEDIWHTMDMLIKYQYLEVISHQSNIGYRFAWDKCRSFVKKSEPHRTKWTIGTNVQIYSSYHASWKHAVIVDQVNDVLTALLDDHKTNVIIDRFQYNMIRSIPIKKKEGGAVQFNDINLISNSKRPSLYSLHASAPSSRRSTLPAVMRDTSDLFAHMSETPILAPVLLPLPLSSALQSSELTLPFGHSARSQRTTMGSIKSIVNPPEFAPCPGDPFWEYYRTVGDLSRANCQEIITVMQWISAEEMMRTLLQQWLHKKIEPIELPYINEYNNAQNKSNFTLQSTTIISFIRQSLKTMQTYTDHPDSFDIPNLTHQYKTQRSMQSMHEVVDSNSRELPDWTGFGRSSSMRSVTALNQPATALNVIGQKILSYLDQNSFVNACVVSRSWLHCSRHSHSRSHVKLRLWNGLKHLIRDADLNSIITESNDIISIDQFIRDNKHTFTAINDDPIIDEFMDENEENVAMTNSNDILLDFVAGRNQNQTLHLIGRRSNKNHDITTALSRFFSKRVECGMFAHICKLQFDFNMASKNKLIYYVKQSLVDSYWDTLSIFLQIETLRELDILLPDPHILLIAYILQHSNNYSSYSKRIVFPSIGIPKSKCICATKELKSLRFAVQSLTFSSLLHMLDTHFEHYHHPMHHTEKYKYQSLQSSNYGPFMYTQSQKQEFRKLKIYRLCKKVIYKSLIFDISNALYDLNHSPVKVQHIQRLSLCDVKCLSTEFTTLLINNGDHLKRIDFMFTQKCLQPKYEIVTAHPSAVSPSTLPSGSTTLMSGSSSTMSINIQNYQHSMTNMSMSSINLSGHNSTMSLSSVGDHHHHHHQSQKDVNKKKLRTRQVLADLFESVIKYMKKQCHSIHAHNHQIKKRFKLAKNRLQRSGSILAITYANKLKILSLDTLSFSFPVDVDVFLLDGFVELMSWFEMNDCPEIALKNIYLDGGAMTPFAYSADNSKLLSWNELLQSQMFNIDSLTLRRTIYSSQIFDDFSAGFVSNLKCIDLQIIYTDEEEPFFSASFGNLQTIESIPHSHAPAKAFAPQSPIKELLQSLRECKRLEVCYLDLIQYDKDHSDEIAPVFDILWVDEFVRSLNIQKTIKILSIAFNELSTEAFEDKTETPKFIKRTHLNLGSILRINGEFKNEIQQMIMSWFAQSVATPLAQITFTRHFFDHDASHSRRYKDDQMNIDLKTSQSKGNNETDDTQNTAYYQVTKQRNSAADCGVDVCGDLVKILQLQNPVES